MSDGKQEDGPKLPPKLDLRKSGILKSTPSPAEPEPAVEPSPVTPPAAQESPKPAAPVQSAQTTNIPPVEEEAASPEPAGEVSVAEAFPKPTVNPAVPVGQVEKAPSEVAASRTSDISIGEGAASRPTPVAAARPVTIKAVPVAAKPATPGAKRSTTKIALDAAKPKTVKAVPTPVASAETTAVSPVPKAKGTGGAEKRKTSRISLESVLGDDQEGEGTPGAPKTIRLKRPGTGGAPKVATQSKTVKAIKRPTPEGADKEAPKAAEVETQTRKKTVVVKRPSAGAAKKLRVARPEADAEAAALAPAANADVAATAVKGPDQPGAFFSVVAIAATLIALATIYMFTAQVIGPNYSMTEYSYAKDGPELVWPGRLSHR
jgi:hypothetical protein